MERCFIACTPGLESALHAEAARLGKASRVPGGAALEGPEGIFRRANLELRTASRVMRELLRISPRDARELSQRLAQLPLKALLRPDTKLQLELVGERGPWSERALRDAVPPSWPLANEGALLRIRAEKGELTVSLDTSGELLYRRGYRQEISRAPLRETLAAGLLELAHYDPAQPLWDPMCGSGTFVIEAALMAIHRAPGIAREFAFEKFADHDARAFEAEKAQLRAAELPKPPSKILGTDLNAGSLGVARRNARRAGVDGFIELLRHDATVPRPLDGPGLVIANLPFGKRVGEDAELGNLYADFAKALRAGVPGWRVGLLANDGKLLERTGLAFEQRHDVDNGGLKCVFAVGRI